MEIWPRHQQFTPKNPTIRRDDLTFLNSLNLHLQRHYTCCVPAGGASKGPLCRRIMCLLCRNSQRCELHHGNGDHKAKVTQRVGRGVARRGQGGGGGEKINKIKEPPQRARSSSPVLQQLPARWARVNKPSAKRWRRTVRKTLCKRFSQRIRQNHK